MSSIPGIKNPGLVIILLEEMLPQCQITATGYDLSLRQETGEGSEEQGEESRDLRGSRDLFQKERVL